MHWPKPLLRKNPKANKNDFGHVLILGGSPSMLGAPSMSALSAMRTGSGLVSCAVPQALNLALQKKISPVIMTLPLGNKQDDIFKLSHAAQLKKIWSKFNAIAIGPGLGTQVPTQRFIREIISTCPIPMVIDADALNALKNHTTILLKTPSVKVLTPHPGEMARLTGLSKNQIEIGRKNTALIFARQFKCILVLKGHQTVVANPKGIYINKTGNVHMATAGSGDVLTGMIASLLGQGIGAFESACFGVCIHGQAGDKAAKARGKAMLIATDIIEQILR